MRTTNIINTIFVMVGVVVMNANLGSAKTVNSNIRIIRQDGFEITLDRSTQVLGLDILDDKQEIIWDEPGRSSSFEEIEAELYPTIKNIWERTTDFVSASILVAKAKQFDDGLYATVECLCQEGTERFISKRVLLQRVADALKRFENEKGVDEGSLNYCRAFISAAAKLGGEQIAETKEVQLQTTEIESDFLSNQLQSEPIGFYTWTEDLKEIFQQDRLLQKNLDSEKKIRLLARGLVEDKNTMATYKKYLLLAEKLTNPFPPEYCNLLQTQNIQLKKNKYSFFPPSQSHETELGKRLYGNRPIPDGFSLIDTLIHKIQEG